MATPFSYRVSPVDVISSGWFFGVSISTASLRATAKRREKKIATCVRMTRLEGIAEAKCCKGQKADRSCSASRGSARQPQSQSARLLIETTSQDQGPRNCGQAQPPREGSGLQRLRGDYQLPKDRRP